MLVLAEKRALGLRHAINFIASRLKDINADMQADPRGGLLLAIYGVVLTIIPRGGNLFLLIEGCSNVPGENFEVKLGRGDKVFNKRVMNDLEVYFHKNHRLYYNSAIKDIENNLPLLNLSNKVKQVTLWERLTGKYIYGILAKGDMNDGLIEIRYRLNVSLFGKIEVVLDLDTKLSHDGIAGRFYPVSAGAQFRYSSIKDIGGIDKWMRGCVLSHVSYLFK